MINVRYWLKRFGYWIRPYDMSLRRELRRTTTRDYAAMPEPLAA